MFNSLTIPKSQVLQIVQPATTNLKIMFPDNKILQSNKNVGVYIKGLEFFPKEILAKAPDGTANMTSTDMCTAYVSLYIDDGYFFEIPLIRLISTHLNTVTAANAENFGHVDYLTPLLDLDINWPKSFILFPAATSLAATLVCAVYFDYGPPRPVRKWDVGG